MTRHIAFLRGINVGGHRVKMDRLRSLFDDLAFNDVITVIASGNVIFSTESDDVDALRERIEDHLGRELGYEVATFLRSPEQLAAIVDPADGGTELGETSTVAHYVMLLHAPAPASLRSALAGLESDMDRFEFADAEIHWRVNGKMSESPLFGGGLERATRATPMTMRNVTTLRRVLSKV